MSPADLGRERRRRAWLSVFVGLTSVLTAVTVYLGITNAIDNASNSDDIQALKRPSKDELAKRVVLGSRECLRKPSCRRELRRQDRQLAGGSPRVTVPGVPRAPRRRNPSSGGPGRQGGGSTPSRRPPGGQPPPRGGGGSTPTPQRPSPLPQLPALPPLPSLPPLPPLP